MRTGYIGGGRVRDSNQLFDNLQWVALQNAVVTYPRPLYHGARITITGSQYDESTCRAALPKEQLVNVARLLDAYVNQVPNSELAEQRVSFGTSGHRGSSFHTSFNEYHVLAITQAICDYRSQADIRGPIFVGRDTHALSEPAQHSALEVLVANGVTVMVAARNDYTPLQRSPRHSQL